MRPQQNSVRLQWTTNKSRSSITIMLANTLIPSNTLANYHRFTHHSMNITHIDHSKDISAVAASLSQSLSNHPQLAISIPPADTLRSSFLLPTLNLSGHTSVFCLTNHTTPERRRHGLYSICGQIFITNTQYSVSWAQMSSSA